MRDARDIRSSLSMPLWQDELATRVAGIKTRFDGTFRNTFSGSHKAIRTTIDDYSFGGTDGRFGGYDNEARSSS